MVLTILLSVQFREHAPVSCGESGLILPLIHYLLWIIIWTIKLFWMSISRRWSINKNSNVWLQYITLQTRGVIERLLCYHWYCGHRGRWLLLTEQPHKSTDRTPRSCGGCTTGSRLQLRVSRAFCRLLSTEQWLCWEMSLLRLDCLNL